MAEEPVLYERDGALAVVTLNRPAVLNALMPALLAALHGAFDRASDEGARCLLLTGAGRGFSAGADLASLQDQYTAEGGVPDLRALLLDHFHPVLRRMRSLDMPVIAAVNGVAAGAGMAIALACDFRVAAENARFSTAFTRIGLVPDCGMGYTLPRLVGAGRTAYLLMTSEQVDAQSALQWGMVERVFPVETFVADARAFAQTLAGGATRAFALTRRMLDQANDLSFEELLAVEADMQAEAGTTRDHREAVAAFLRKEQAVFEGR